MVSWGDKLLHKKLYSFEGHIHMAFQCIIKQLFVIILLVLSFSNIVVGQEGDINKTLILELKDIYPIDTIITSETPVEKPDHPAERNIEEPKLTDAYEGHEHLKISLIRIFAFSVEPDEDRNEVDLGIEFEHQVRTGDGYGISLELFLEGSKEDGYRNAGFLFLTTSHKESQTHEDVSSYSFYIEGVLGGTEQLNKILGINLSVCGGVGIASFDFEGEQNDSTSGAVEIRASVGLEFFRQLELGLNGGAYLWGYPSETVGYGSFIGAQASLIF